MRKRVKCLNPAVLFFLLGVGPLVTAQSVEDTSVSTAKIEEVVIVGYGKQKKVNLTGSVSTVGAEALEDRPVTSSVNAIQGTMPGVTITTNNGQPGRDTGTVRVRGIGTLNNSNPLVIVDGVIASMSEVNPSDIQNISVLKDASSAAIYGSRAANGVILITTKRGRKGRLRVSFDSYIAKQDVHRLPDFLPSWKQAVLFNEARANEGQPAYWTEEEIQKFKNGGDPMYPNTDWLKLLYDQAGIQRNYYLNVRGGSEKTTYMFSVGYFDQKGNIKNTNYTKYTTRFNVSTQVTDKIKLDANLSYFYAPFKEPVSTYAASLSQIIRQANRISNTVPFKYPNGEYGSVADGNPIAWIDLGSFNKYIDEIITGSFGGEIEILKGLKFRPSFSYRLTGSDRKQFVKDIQYYGPEGDPLFYQGPNNLTVTHSKNVYYNLTGLLDYEKTIAGDHHLHILLGASREHNKYKYMMAYRERFLNNEITELDAAPKQGQQNSGTANEWALASVFGRFNYDYKGKYLLEVNVRRDGSSRFAPQNRWGTFPSVSVGWNISDEPFFHGLKDIVSGLKLRASWGKLGNQQIGNYPTFASVSSGHFYPFNQNVFTGIALTSGANPDITWESTETSGVGVDLAFLNGKIALSADYFNRKTNDILLQLPVSAVYALSTPYQNAGSVLNKGVELSARYRARLGDFRFNLSGNFTYTKNEITDLKGTGPYISGGTFQKVGYPINSLYGFVADGLFQTQQEVDSYAKYSFGNNIGPGDIKYRDLNNDGVIDGDDRTYLGTYFPKITYAFNIDVRWKALELSLFFQGVGGVKVGGGNLIGLVGGSVNKATSVFWDRWTVDNPNAEFPRVWYGYSQNDPSSTPSSFWVKSAAYLRLKNITLSYNLPKSALKHIGLKEAKIYYSGQNLLTFTNFYSWMDPEIGSTGSIYSYPQTVVNSLGISFTF